jgi:zinc-ribbon domain
MVCQNCGTEIADKALVCFRCGQATTAPVRRPPPPPSRVRSLMAFVGLVVLILAALFLGRAGTIAVPETVRWAVIAAAVALLVWRMAVRRR